MCVCVCVRVHIYIYIYTHIYTHTYIHTGIPKWLSSKESACQFRRHRRREFDPWVGKIAWRKGWQPTPIFLPGKFHGQRTWWATVHEVTKSWTRLSHWAHVHVYISVLVAQSCLTLCDTLDYSPQDYSIHRILQARMMEWVAISFSKGSSQTRVWTSVSCIAGRFFTIWVTREAHIDKKFPYETWILKNLLFFFPSPVKSFRDPKCMDGSFNTFYFSITVY